MRGSEHGLVGAAVRGHHKHPRIEAVGREQVRGGGQGLARPRKQLQARRHRGGMTVGVLLQAAQGRDDSGGVAAGEAAQGQDDSGGVFAGGTGAG